MKIVLLANVPKVGRKNEVREVSAGYARNFLINKKLAVLATPLAIKTIDKKNKSKEEELRLSKELLKKSITEKNLILTITCPANEDLNLYAQVGEEEIRDALTKKYRIELPQDALIINGPIKVCGTFEIKISAHDTEGKLILTVEPRTR